MGTYAMKRLADEAKRNFRKGIRAFKLFGNVEFRIEHMHDNEYGVLTIDPISGRDSEILRLYDVSGNLEIA